MSVNVKINGLSCTMIISILPAADLSVWSVPSVEKGRLYIVRKSTHPVVCFVVVAWLLFFLE